MKFLPLVLKHMRRNWIRTGSTVAAMALSVLLFCVLQSAVARLDRVIDSRSPKRLITRHAVSFMFTLPVSYGDRIRALPGVKRVASETPFVGFLPARKEEKAAGGGSTDWANAFQNIAVDAESFFAMSPELYVPPAQLRDFMRDLRGCLIGRQLAERFGWKVGDRFFLESMVSGYRKKSGPFEFVIRGLIDPGYRGAETDVMLFHFKYLDEGLGGGIRARMFLIEIDDPRRAAEIGAAIDALFENSDRQTLTETERAFTAEFMSMAGDLGALVNGIGLAVCFTILLVTANTMSMALRERRTEIAVLKTLGFTSGQVMSLVVSEALVLGGLGGVLGIAGTYALLWVIDHATSGRWLGLTGLGLGLSVALFGFDAALVVAFAAGFMPAWGAYRARVTEMLRTV
jgi:putative ABC transport system permease protein